MAIISLRQLLDHAAENNYGVPAFNVNNLEQIRAIMEGANEVNSPVIVQASAGARKYARPAYLKKLVEAAIEDTGLDVVLHLDHGEVRFPKRLQSIFKLIALNFCYISRIASTFFKTQNFSRKEKSYSN